MCTSLLEVYHFTRQLIVEKPNAHETSITKLKVKGPCVFSTQKSHQDNEQYTSLAGCADHMHIWLSSRRGSQLTISDLARKAFLYGVSGCLNCCFLVYVIQ